MDDYDGTVLLVSHDRDFLDRVATVTVALEGDGRATVYAGGWSDSDPEVYTSAPAKAEKASAALAERQAKLDAAEEEWLTLEEKAAG
jgi:ATP-binding cassette subfamily F protein uup